MQGPQHSGLWELKLLTRCFFITPNTAEPFPTVSTDQVSEAESCEDDLEDRLPLPLLFWPPLAANQSIVSDTLDWDPAGPVFKRSEQYSVFAAADQKVKEELFRLVYHYSQIGRDMFGSPNDESKGETLPVGKMTNVVFHPYRICILNTGNFSWCYLGYITDAVVMLQSQLQMLHAALTFYIGPLPALVEEFSVKSLSEMREHIKIRLLAAGIDDKQLMGSGVFSSLLACMSSRNPIPLLSTIPTFSWYLPPSTVTPTARLFLEASQILNRFNCSARKDRFVYGGAIFVDATAPPAPGSRIAERSFSLLFTNLDMSVTRYLHHEVDRRVSVATYAQPRWVPASLLLDANLELASQEDQLPVWDASSMMEMSSQRSPLLQSVMRPQNDGIDDVTGFLGTSSITTAQTHSPVRRPAMQPPLHKKSDGRWIGLFSLECGNIRLVMLVTMRSCNEGHLMERLRRGLTPQVESVGRIFDEHRRQDILMIQERDEFQRSINQEEDEDCIECVWMYDSNLNRELLNHNMSDSAAESAAHRLKPLTFASTIAHINDMYARDPALSRVITRNKVGHVYSRRTFGIQAYLQLCAPQFRDSAIETRLEDSASKIFSEKLGGWL